MKEGEEKAGRKGGRKVGRQASKQATKCQHHLKRVFEQKQGSSTTPECLQVRYYYFWKGKTGLEKIMEIYSRNDPGTRGRMRL